MEIWGRQFTHCSHVRSSAVHFAAAARVGRVRSDLWGEIGARRRWSARRAIATSAITSHATAFRIS
jgi:hypothetical protein